MDIAAISTLLGSIKTATEIAKLIKESDLTLEKAETKLKLADLVSALADARIEAAEIQQLIAERDAKVRELEERLRVKESLIYEEPSYWQRKEETKDGPYCQQCYDKEQRLIRLQGNGEGYWECKACKNHYKDARYRAAIEIINRSEYDPFGRY